MGRDEERNAAQGSWWAHPDSRKYEIHAGSNFALQRGAREGCPTTNKKELPAKVKGNDDESGSER